MTFHCLYEGKFTRGLESGLSQQSQVNSQTTISLPSNTTSVSSKMNTLQWRIQDGAFGANAPPPSPPSRNCIQD